MKILIFMPYWKAGQSKIAYSEHRPFEIRCAWAMAAIRSWQLCTAQEEKALFHDDFRKLAGRALQRLLFLSLSDSLSLLCPAFSSS